MRDTLAIGSSRKSLPEDQDILQLGRVIDAARRQQASSLSARVAPTTAELMLLQRRRVQEKIHAIS